jgi:hypothetical protein
MSRARHGRPGGGSKEVSTGRGTAGPERNLCADEVVPYLQEGDPFDRGRLRSERRHGCVLALQFVRVHSHPASGF